ncbi:glycosyltransferase [Methylobacterium sp. NEAU K]|uniref:glycosyltransferase n=1 Tax=Methylobacterium sp. NEAU K TaxID=3064946 RepID=UPI0027348B27|nr:glycosyltransferase [Methylobacterium sp. NEAU K]MDP4001885.1 glycosyltransferase [Methylobacterium sp. NEAU K]
MDAAGKTVSVVIATYNGSVFIRSQLESVISQSFKPLEVIISDDGSTDDTLAIVRSVASHCDIPIIIKVNAVNLGFRDNFLAASLDAKGDFIAFCDQDDIWDLTKLECAAAYFCNKNISLIVHSAASLEQSTGRLVKFSQGIRQAGIKPPLSYDPWLTFFGFSIVFRRELLYLADINARFTDFIAPKEKIAHDRWIMFLGQVVGETAELDLPLVKYRQHAANLFGDGRRGRKANAQKPIQVFDDYISATSGMIDVIRDLPHDTVADFPLFDRAKALHFFQRALRQLECRRGVYVTRHRGLALWSVIGNIRSGIYRSVHSDTVRWRSIARDLKFCLTRS